MNDLNTYRNSITSQYGEDGIIKEILNRIGTKNKTCVEFGAGPGKDSSNTWDLISSYGWRGILIELQEKPVEKWKKETQNYNVTILNQFVQTNGENSLDCILGKEKVPLDIDLMSIDIDGDDYHIFKEIKIYRPRIIVIEYNSTIPPQTELVQDLGEKDPYGASARSLLKLAHEKGYKLATTTTTNCIFVAKEEFDKLSIIEPRIEEVFDTSNLTYLISTYGGSNFLMGSHRPPAYSWFYDIFNLNLTPKVFHSISFGLFMNRIYSKKLSEDLIPVKVFTNKNERIYGIFKLSLLTIKKLTLGIRLFLKKIVPQSVVKKVRQKNINIKWYLAGRPDPAPDPIKQKIVRKFGKKHHLKTFIETGTAGGLMIKAVRRTFPKIISIELFDELYENAKKMFAADENIKIIHGDSGKKLAEILPEITEPAFFWLDAHYSGEGTAKGETETPIVKELLIIFARKNEGDVIMVDDVRCFDGTHDYPQIEKIRDLVTKQDRFSFRIVRDMMIIEPTI